MKYDGIFFLALGLFCVGCATSKAPQPNVNISGLQKLQIPGDLKLIFEANSAVMKHDYPGAEGLYTQAIAINPNNTEAYLQRGFIRREMKNAAGAADDGRKAVMLANIGLQQEPGSAMLYHQRGMGERLLKDFDHAKDDIAKSLQLGGQADWQTDLQAIVLEQKESLAR